jgi:hypothetical protein
LRDGGWAKIRQHSGPEFGSPALSVLVELVLEDWIGERPGLTSVVLCPCPLLCRPSFPACSG